MKRYTLTSLMLAAVCASSAPAVLAQQDKATAPSSAAVKDAKVDAVKLTVVGEITAIDPAKRTVDIKGPRGRTATFLVGPEAKNLDRVKVGDRVQLDYIVGIALALIEGGDGIREKVESEAASVAEKGAQPGGAAVKRTTIVANVEKVDRKRKLATLKGPEGRIVDVQVRDPAVLKDIKAGDQVVANVTESVAVSVQPAPAKK
jgi:hypothetical protein